MFQASGHPSKNHLPSTSLHGGIHPKKKHLGITGWWLSHPSEKYEFVSIIRNIWKKICQTTNQDNV